MPTLTRRHFLAATAGALGAAALGDGFLIEPTAIDVTHHDVPIPGLPAALDGVRIACLADVHLHHGVSRAAPPPPVPRPVPRRSHPRRPDSLARRHTGPTGRQRTLRRRLVPGHDRPAVRVARDWDSVHSGAAVLPPRATRLHPPFVGSRINTLTFRELDASFRFCRFLLSPFGE